MPDYRDAKRNSEANDNGNEKSGIDIWCHGQKVGGPIKEGLVEIPPRARDASHKDTVPCNVGTSFEKGALDLKDDLAIVIGPISKCHRHSRAAKVPLLFNLVEWCILCLKFATIVRVEKRHDFLVD